MIIKSSFPKIDMQLTGIKIKELVTKSGYSVKQIQEYLHLSCPQPIYRWFKGKVLPSLDHLYALSKFFNVQMEDIVVPTSEDKILWLIENTDDMQLKRYLSYFKSYNCAA